MKISLLVLGSPLGSACGDSAWHYAEAAHRAGHELASVFFLHDGVYHGNDFAAPAQDEIDRTTRWARLAAESGAELLLCVASAARRGVLDPDEARRHGKAAGNAHGAFALAGLGQLLDAASRCDRLLTFGGA